MTPLTRTAAPIEAATFIPLTADQIQAQLIEWTDHKGARHMFSLSRSFLYQLAAENKIRSVSIRRPGALKGRKLFNVQSIKNFLAKCESETGEANMEAVEKDAAVHNHASSPQAQSAETVLSKQIEAIRHENQILMDRLAALRQSAR